MINPMEIDIHHTSREDLIREVRKLEAFRDLAIEALEEIKARAYYVRDDAEIYILADEALSKLKDNQDGECCGNCSGWNKQRTND